MSKKMKHMLSSYFKDYKEIINEIFKYFTVGHGPVFCCMRG